MKDNSSACERAEMPARSRQHSRIPNWIGGCLRSLKGIETRLTVAWRDRFTVFSLPFLGILLSLARVSRTVVIGLVDRANDVPDDRASLCHKDLVEGDV